MRVLKTLLLPVLLILSLIGVDGFRTSPAAPPPAFSSGLGR
ncbi:hypothetical protein [Pseudomonas sp. zfem005]|nr:hypothetical protein [Pseudomonas sp. zfem005]MDU9416466.1 hypothetical protein [Pseudomonas sp. zfem005]